MKKCLPALVALFFVVTSEAQPTTRDFVDSCLTAQRPDYHSKKVNYILNQFRMADSAAFYSKLSTQNWEHLTYIGYIPCAPDAGEGCKNDFVIVSFWDKIKLKEKKRLLKAARYQISDPAHFITTLYVNNKRIPDAEKTNYMNSINDKTV